MNSTHERSDVACDSDLALTERFHTSSFCDGGGCVAVAAKGADKVVVKSTITDQEVSFSCAEWRAFTQGVKADEFELA